MQTWTLVAAVVLPVVLVLVVFIVILRRCCLSKGRNIETTRITSSEGLQAGIAKLHLSYQTNSKNAVSHDLDYKRKMNYYVLRRELSMKAYFNWADHPSLVSEAVEHGWSRFAFHGHNISSPSTRSKLLALCVSGDQARESGAEVSWEICLGSAEFMQKVRLNSGLKKANLDTTPPLGVACATQTALPLPGPTLGNSSFPQEGYFEIIILSSRENDARARVKDRKGEGDKTRLIEDVENVNAQADELKIDVNEEATSEVVSVSVGLAVGGSHPRRLPGSYSGSIGFNSDGSVYLDGTKLVFENEKAEWGSTDKVIGCGFDPSQKKVYFTVDSELVHVIHCKSDDFGRPLYPTLAANIDVTVLVNFGQSSFKYAPANLQRTPDPCFIGSLSNGRVLGYEDSKELFSMGRIDSEWLDRSTTKSSHSTITYEDSKELFSMGKIDSEWLNRSTTKGDRKIENDEESETDLFEIVLDNRNRSPSTFL